jgi:hypothetical protein
VFSRSLEERLSEWFNIRKKAAESPTPLEDVWQFWKAAPFIPHNKNIDPYYQRSWPTPWEIIAENRYDEFTKCLMIAWTLKLIDRFVQSDIDIRIYVDKDRRLNYNLVFIDNTWIVNYSDEGPILVNDLPDSLILENILKIDSPR